jgi:hypothetical protein
MPLDDACRFDQHHGVEDLQPDLEKPHPEQPVGGEEPRLAGALPTQDGHLVPQNNKLELQRSAAEHPEREQGTDCGEKCDNAHNGIAVAQETLHLVGGFDFCAGTGERGTGGLVATAVGRSDRPHATESAPSPIPSLGSTPLESLSRPLLSLSDSSTRSGSRCRPEAWRA